MLGLDPQSGDDQKLEDLYSPRTAPPIRFLARSYQGSDAAGNDHSPRWNVECFLNPKKTAIVSWLNKNNHLNWRIFWYPKLPNNVIPVRIRSLCLILTTEHPPIRVVLSMVMLLNNPVIIISMGRNNQIFFEDAHCSKAHTGTPCTILKRESTQRYGTTASMAIKPRA